MRLLAAIMLCLIGLSGSMPRIRTTAEPLPHDAYIWQRLWTPQLVSSVRRSADIVRAWRVLMAEADATGRWTTVAVPWPELTATQRPIVGVIRIDGRLDDSRVAPLLDQIVARVAPLSATLAGLEIDFDCPTSKLSLYARFLAELRGRLPRPIALSITALPTWMNSTALEKLSPSIDEVVLQVHAVDDPRRGLFDAAQADRWVREFGRRLQRPLRVALPAYEVRVTWREDGRLASVEGEMPLLLGASRGGGERERLGAAPDAVLQLVHSLQRTGPERLVGFAWFRLPTDTDSRAWSLQTWRAVIGGSLPPVHLKAVLLPAESDGLWTVTLSNEGATDATLPRQVRLDPGCEMADGANGFHLVAANRPLVLQSAGSDQIRAHRHRIIGWARCAAPERTLDVVQ
ncbi:DUF3142 domain-containing protein [soil metagenome]